MHLAKSKQTLPFHLRPRRAPFRFHPIPEWFSTDSTITRKSSSYRFLVFKGCRDIERLLSLFPFLLPSFSLPSPFFLSSSRPRIRRSSPRRVPRARQLCIIRGVARSRAREMFFPFETRPIDPIRIIGYSASDSVVNSVIGI